MNILFAAAECAPLAKVGGLGDVIGSLPKALKQTGTDARVILPMYKNISPPAENRSGQIKLEVNFGTKKIAIKVHQTTLPQSSVVLYLLEEAQMFGSGGVYETADATPGSSDEVNKFLFFCQCVAEFLKQKIWQPDVLHVHDWHASLTPLLIKLDKIPIPALLTIHNLAMQGLAPAQSLEAVRGNLTNQPSMQADLAKYSNINLLRQGILHSDAVSTVSPSYAREIITHEFGEGLESELSNLNNVYGIINGIDETVWNEASDPFISSHYSQFSPELKLKNKPQLQKDLGLKVNPGVPLVGIVSRLTGQKGFDLLPSIREELVKQNCQIVALGVGEKNLEDFFRSLSAEYPDRFILKEKFDERLAHQIYASSDIFLMPSRFEPCGLGQMIAMHYGSIPIVRATGGLKDTVINLADDLENLNAATGFVFEHFDPQSLLAQISRAINTYQNDPVTWKRLEHNAMVADFSWTASAQKYNKLYQKIIDS